ncbi:MAG: hypothetical protein HKN91_08680 [Acidimicrobiia bacterium]|nr:hypothetical protein [Acidimicrobiia bacterium]
MTAKAYWLMQPAHQPEPGELERKLSDLFPNERLRDAARSALSRYGRESWHQEIERVRLGILKLAGPHLTQIDKQVDAASVDYRDTLAAAEYPAYSQLTPGIDPQDAAAQEAIAADLQQYLDWLNG